MESLLLGIIALTTLHLYYRAKTYSSILKDLDKARWKNAPLEKYIQNCYDLVADNFSKVDGCWLKFPWRNMFYRNVWKSKISVPCHMQNFLFQKCLAQRMHRSKIRTKVTQNLLKGAIIHFYAQVQINDQWTDIDVWGKKWGIPFGRNINNIEWRS
jgi:hypothetical protein